MTQKEMKEAREAILFQAQMYLETFMYFKKEVKIDEMAHRLASDFLKAQYEGISRGNRPDTMRFLFYPKEGDK